jgi:trk system potassium uptake protein TrkA
VHVVVVGCGRVGSELAIWLDESGHSVAVIDKDPSALAKRLPETWRGTKVVGFGYDKDDLVTASIERADALVAVTSGDNSNIIAARVARETYEVPYVVARIYDPRRAVIYQRLGIPTVATVSWTVDQIRRRLIPDAVTADWTDATGELSLIERPLPAAWAGKRLAELCDDLPFRIVGLVRDGRAQLAADNAVGQEGDVLHIMCSRDALESLAVRLAGAPADEHAH